MYTEVYGSGPPLLMIHGNNGSMNAFEENVSYCLSLNRSNKRFCLITS
jgi:pimeloyl-ACP methyl ester carboxylesterase